MITIVLLATAWGSRHGGINVVNMELTRALAGVLGDEGRVVCVVPHAEDGDVEDVEKSGARLVSLGLAPDKLPDCFDPGWIDGVEKRLRAAGVGSIDWCIGHDAISGAAANIMKRSGGARGSAVISHMSYADYQGVKHPQIASTEDKIREQERILRAADEVIAVGPLLRQCASDLSDRPASQFIPGLPAITPRPPRQRFVAVSFGRFERANDRIKQIQLAAEGLAEARHRANQMHGPAALLANPTLKLIGIVNDDEDVKHLRKVSRARARQIVNLRPMPYKEDREELYREIAGSSVALMLSWHEGFGLTGWEAIAAEVPLIVSEQTGLHHFLRDEGLHGLVHGVHIDGSYGDDENPNFTDEDLARVASLILKVAQEPETAQKMAKVLKDNLVQKGFSWVNAARTFLKALGIEPPPEPENEPPGPDGGSSGPHDPAPTPGPTLATYLARLREQAGWVRLTGELERRPLQDVFVELEVTRGSASQERERTPGASDEPHGTPQEADALKDELHRRRSAPWRTLTSTIRSEDLLDFAHRTLIVGAAGTGKSTLLRWIAREAAGRREGDESARIPIWLERLPPHDDLEDDLPDALAKRALHELKLDEGTSDAFFALRDAIASGRALVLIDSLDEKGQVERERATEWLTRLEGRVVLASRPLAEGWQMSDTVTVTLHGVPSIAAEQLLRRYFVGEDWVDGLLNELRGLPDGQTWLETPVLLGLAATLYRADRSLPRATIDLYRRAIDHFLSSERLPTRYRGEALRRELRQLARERLLPEKGAPRVIFDWNEVRHDRREFYRLTGLFDGDSSARFSHLTLGEYLAAEADIDLPAERKKLLAIQGPTLEGRSLEVLPMAHALRGVTSLQEALAEARERDLSDHRLLRLLLRALGYGGAGVLAFCRSHAGEVVQLVAERLNAPSGRFGEAEVALMDAAERAFRAMRGLVGEEYVERAFGRLLRAWGNVGTEAHVATWILGVREPSRRESDWWATVERQARALVRANVGIDGVLQLTQGADSQNQYRAALHLAGDPEMWPRLRPLLYHEDDMGRRYVSSNLVNDVDSEPDWRERLSDEDSTTREWCIAAAGERLAQRPIYLPRLRDILARDPNDRVRASAIDALANDPASRKPIRDILSKTIPLPDRFVGDLVTLRNAAIRALATDTESEDVIRTYVGGPKPWHAEDFHRRKHILETLMALPKWRSVLLERLGASDVTTKEIEIIGKDPDSEESLKRLLDSADDDVLNAAVKALGERADRDRLVRLLAHESVSVRCATIEALGKHVSMEPRLCGFLVQSAPERIAAAKALAGDASSQGPIRDNLLRHPENNVRLAAIRALAGHPAELDSLRAYFEETRSKPRSEWPDGGDHIGHEALRAEILKALAADPRYRDLVEGSLDDPHERVRAEAVRTLAIDPSMTDRLERQFHDDNDVFVYEAFCDRMPDHAFVKKHLKWCLNADQGALRFATFRYFVDRAEDRERLRAMLSSPTEREEWRATLIGPLTRDPESLALVRARVDDDSDDVRIQALRTLRHDRHVRESLRQKAIDPEWLKSRQATGRVPKADLLASDPEAHPILLRHLDTEDQRLLTIVAPLLESYSPAYPELARLLDHASIEVQGAAMRALGAYEPARARLIAALEPDPPVERGPDTDMREVIDRSRVLRTLRRAAAEALKDTPDLRIKFRSLLGNEDKDVREAAIHSVSADRTPAALSVLRDRLRVEKEEDLRDKIIDALRGDPASAEPLRDRLHNDYHRNVRKAAADALGLGDLSPAYALQNLPPVARIASVLAGTAALALDPLQAFLKAPRRLDLDKEPELGEDVLAWACARLAWAYEIERPEDGQVLGEVATPMDRLTRHGNLILIRAAMDAFDLPRERFLRPNHNLMEAWDIAQHLVASDPPTVILACADVSFAHLQPPPLAPGEVRFGPTLFGFRVSQAAIP